MISRNLQKYEERNMDLSRKIYQSSDISFKYAIAVLNKQLHKYLKLKEEYKVSYPTEVITRDMRNLRMDSLYRTDTQLNNIESQSTKVGIKEMKRFADYRTFAEYIYNLPVETIILMTDDPKNSLKEYKISETDILRPIFIYFTKEEVMKRFKNVTDKIENNRKLTEEETLDIAFLPLFAAKENSQEITEKMCELIKKCKQIDYELKREISFILQIMVFKYFDDSKKREQLLGEINMKQYDSDLEMIAYEIYGEDLEEQKEIIKQKDNTIQQQSNDIKQKDNTIQQQSKLLKGIKEKNNLDKETSAKIDAILSQNQQH